MTTAPCRIAIVGLGKIAADQHLPAIEQSAMFETVATVDPASAGIADLPHFPSFDQLMASGIAFDAVSICTPPQFRAGIALQAIAAGKHVLLEKPPGATLAEAEALREEAAAAGVIVFAAWHSRYAAAVAPARQWLEGKIIRSVAIIWREDVRVWHLGQDWIWREGGFGVFDPGINALSIATTILPNPLEVVGGTLQFPSNCEAPISGQLSLTDSAGLPVSLDLDFLQTGPQSWDIRVHCEEGDLVLSHGGARVSAPGLELSAEDHEYSAVYAHFAQSIAAGTSEIDLAPLALVGQALSRCKIERVAEFHE